MKLKLFVSALIVAGVVGGAYAAKDPVLMKINNKEVKVSEFEYLYKKNLEQQVNKESIDEYVDRFVNYKLKVAEAERLGYDTLPRIKKELEGYDEQFLKEEVEKILLNRYGEPEEVADLVEFLISDKAKYINNSVIRIDGGQMGSN